MKIIKTSGFKSSQFGDDGGGLFHPESQDEADEYERIMGDSVTESGKYEVSDDPNTGLWYVFHTGEVADEPVGGWENSFPTEELAIMEAENFAEQDDESRIHDATPDYQNYDPEYDVDDGF